MPKVKPPLTSSQALVRIQPHEFPHFSDDMSYDSLETAIHQSLGYLAHVPESTPFRFGPDTFTPSHLRNSMIAFLELIHQSPSKDQMKETIKNTFSIYRSVGHEGHGMVLFTGYYEPILRGSLEPSADYPYPVYRRPDDWVRVDLGVFNPRYANERIVGRHVDQAVIPYFSREDIDAKGLLQGKGCELLWVSDHIDLFFLHIQGSGRVLLENGSHLHVNYDANNGLPYQSIGRLLMEEGLISREELSMEKIRSYLRNHPEDMQRVLNHNKRYVFFRLLDQGPLGAIEVPLTPGRSIATDMALFPKGALAFIQTEKPLVHKDGRIGSWENFGRFVLNHDAGAEIQGPGRVDLFWGSSPYAVTAAGHMQSKGTLYFLVLKHDVEQ
jgi:membrane-bound lytic murein transglycosylase A